MEEFNPALAGKLRGRQKMGGTPTWYAVIYEYGLRYVVGQQRGDDLSIISPTIHHRYEDAKQWALRLVNSCKK